ncbi:MAG TPA: tetratricopeptide repeat protein [Candidatus Kapabacteria bacterium]|nr:tetratricopeptide repeat protein [Candidatus Kapabacteria bacterium]
MPSRKELELSGIPLEPSPLDQSNRLRVAVIGVLGDVTAERAHLSMHLFDELRDICRARGGDFAEMKFAADTGAGTEAAQSEALLQRQLDEVAARHAYVIAIVGTDSAGLQTGSNGETSRRFPWQRASGGGAGVVPASLLPYVLSNTATVGRLFFYMPARHGGIEPETRAAEHALRAAEEAAMLIRSSRHPLRDGIESRDELVAHIRADLEAVIDRLLPACRTLTPLALERRAHEAFALSRTRAYVEIPEYLERLEQFAFGRTENRRRSAEQRSGRTGLVVAGPSGCGKSALLAYWTGRLQHERREAFIVLHHVAITSSGSDHVPLLRHVMMELRERYALADAVPADGAEIEKALPLWLGHVQNENLVLIIDGLDQLQPESQDLAWLPLYIPPRVTVIVSTTESHALEVLREREWEELHVQPLTLEQRRDLAHRYAAEFGRRHNLAQLDRISLPSTGGNPLHLRTQLEESGRGGSAAELNEHIDYYLTARDLPELFERVLVRLEERFGRENLRTVLTLILASRRGLSETELAGASGIEREELAAIVQALNYHLMEREGLLTYYHDHMRRAVDRRYLFGRRDELKRVRWRIAGYFGSEQETPRRAEELPWQLAAIGEVEELRAAITDIPLAMELLKDNDPYQLLHYWLVVGNRGEMAQAYFTAMERYRQADTSPRALVAALRTMAEFFVQAGEYEAAERFCRSALSVHHTAGRPDWRDSLGTLDSLAALLYHTGRYTEAIEISRRALAVRETGDGITGPEIAKNLADLGAVCHAMHAYDDAEDYLMRALTIANDTDDTILALAANNLGALRATLGHFEEAARFFEHALQLNRRLLGAEHLEVASNLVNIGFALQRTGNTAAATAQYREALGIAERVLGSQHPHVALFLTNLGMLLRETSQLDEATDLLMRAADIRRETFGPDAIETATSMTRLAGALCRQERYGEALALYREAIVVQEPVLGGDHPEIIQIFRIMDEIEERAEQQ